MLYVLTSVWMLGTPNIGQNILFSHITHEKCEKGKNEEKCGLNLVFVACTRNSGNDFRGPKIGSDNSHFLFIIYNMIVKS